MKKLSFILMGTLLLFTGCMNSDENYIETVKKYKFHDNVTVEKLVNNNIIGGEVHLKNDKNFLFNGTVLYMLNFGSKDEINSTLEQSGFILPEKTSQVKWTLKEKVKNGRIIEVSDNKIKVIIETEENKKYIKVPKNKIKTYKVATNELIPQEELEIMMELYNLAIKNGYKNN